MKRSDMIETIASYLICGELGFPHWDTALDMAEILLSGIEKEGMRPPFNENLFIKSKNQYVIECANGNEWELENGS